MISPRTHIFDRTWQRQHRARAAALGPSTFLIDRAAEDLSDRLAAVLRRFEYVLDLGTPTDAARRALAASGKVGTIVSADVLAGTAASRQLQASGGASGARLVVAADEEALPFHEGSFDLVVSALALQFVNDLPGTLVQIRRALKPDGLLLAALVGGETLTELRQAFAAADIDRVTARYASPISLMHDLRRMGATNALLERSRRPLRRTTLIRMMQIYGERFADSDGRIRATFEIIWLSGWVPHETQQKPLAPGSARRRLADALGAKEIRLPRDDDR